MNCSVSVHGGCCVSSENEAQLEALIRTSNKIETVFFLFVRFHSYCCCFPLDSSRFHASLVPRPYILILLE